MAETNFFGLYKVGPGTSLADNDYQFGTRDRDKIDALLYKGAVGHTHTGDDVAVEDPTQAPQLTLETTGGNIPAGVTVRYKYTYVDEFGSETAASPEATIATPTAVSAPGAPILSSVATGGALLPGNYFYALSAYAGANTNETVPGPRGYLTINSGTTNVITLILPTVPVGADGFNVYRRAPGELNYSYLESIDMSVATPPTDYEDDGALNPNCNRQPPRVNTTNSTNSITVVLPGATPTVPAGLTWKVYRTFVAGNYSASLLQHVVEETTEGSGIINPEFDDVGASTQSSSPPTASEFISNPSKIDLDDATEVQGKLPPLWNEIPQVVTFAQSGTLETGTGSFMWVCEFDEAEIQYVRCALGRDSVPASTDVIVDVNKYDANAATPSWATIFTTQANRPKVLVGDTFGEPAEPDVIILARGDALTIDIDQVGGGATPTDEDLIVNVFLIVRSGGYISGVGNNTYVWS